MNEEPTDRVLLTGATGFVGGNVAAILTEAEVPLLCAVRRDPGPHFPWPWRVVDLESEEALRRALADHAATAVLHLAIDNDLAGLYRDRRAGHRAYVGLTRSVVDAANAHGALIGYLSTDWVFDGTTHCAVEDEPVAPVNLYGLFKALSEQVVLDRADRGFVARVGGVQGRHRTQPATPRAQDCGFGYLVASVVDSLSAGRPFGVWTDARINSVATPVTAAEIGRVLHRATTLRLDGVLHIAGSDAVTRAELARAACAVFDLDPGLLYETPVPIDALLPAPIPFDTSLSAPRTTELLGRPPTPLREQLTEFCSELVTESSPVAVRRGWES